MKNKAVHAYIKTRIAERKKENTYRFLSLKDGLIDFASNDYLGLARSSLLKSVFIEDLQRQDWSMSSTGSRLLTGNSLLSEELEIFLASYHKSSSALLFNSGYDANIGLLSALPYRGDMIIMDELIHASMRDGAKMSKANACFFKHNDILDLEKQLSQSNHKGLTYVCVESVYSMDGDFAPLQSIAKMCQKYDAALIVDEAHATGIFGPKGEGRVVELGLENMCFARIHTFGKAMGTHGAVILGEIDLRAFLMNYARSFIYTTALAPHHILSIKKSYDILSKSIHNTLKINNLSRLFNSLVESYDNIDIILSNSPIKSILISDNSLLKQIAHRMYIDGYDVRPIVYPTVAKGKERLRICLHVFNTKDEIEYLVKTISRLIAISK